MSGLSAGFFGLLLVLPVAVATSLVPTPTPVLIDSRDDWVTFGFAGRGTQSEPYRVENLRFDFTGHREAVAITIKDVPDFAVIQNVLIVGGRVGVQVSNAPNVKIENITVRGADIGIIAREKDIQNVAIAANRIGIEGENLTIKNASFTDNQQALLVAGANVRDSTFVANGIGLDVSARPPVASTVAYSLFQGNRIAGIRASTPLTVWNSTFEGNAIGLHYIGVDDAVSVRGTNFGTHSQAALSFQPTTAVEWRLDARENFWGRDHGGNSTPPSPFGIGSHIVGDVDYEPIAPSPIEEAGPTTEVGAIFANEVPPKIIEKLIRIEPEREGVVGIFGVFALEDPVGLGSWSLSTASHSERGALGGATSFELARRILAPVVNDTVHLEIEVQNVLGMTTSMDFNRSTLPPPPPPVEDTDTDLEQGTSESPPVAVAVLLVTVGVAAMIRPRKRA